MATLRHIGMKKGVILDFRCTSAVKSLTSRCVPALVLVSGLEHSDVDYEVEPPLDARNYSEQQREALSEAFRSRGLATNAHPYHRRTAEELPGLVRIAFEGLAMYPVYKLLDEIYDAWARSVLGETLFRPRNGKEAPSLQIETEVAEAVIVSADDCDLAVALDLLGEVIEHAQPFWSQRVPQLTYRAFSDSR
jgi:hypothetical protein